jgi:effector-binding domain-containing protein
MDRGRDCRRRLGRNTAPRAVVTIHCGPYDQLQASYAALEEWIAANGFHSAGAPGEAYLNDPADHPNPQDWKTEVCWPVAT